MAHQISSAAAVKLDDNTGVLVAISGSVNSVTINGGNALVDDTGIGDSRRTEIRDVDPIMEISLNGMLNTTTEAIIMPLMDGTGVAKTVEILTLSGKYISGEANVAAVSHSIPIGLQTWSLSLRTSDTTGFARTSVAL